MPRLQIVANVAGAALLLWLAAPLLAIDGRHPFESPLARLSLLCATALMATAAWAGVRWLQRRRNAQLFAQFQAGHAASELLAQRFSNAMHLLRSGLAATGTDKSRWWQPRRHVYQLPWYMFIGAPGAGKTTALLHSGLRFPLAERLGTRPVAGIGGTRQCDWWFTDQAVFIDTAGRYTTQDSQTAGDAQEWGVFLQLLRRYRPAQPINGVIVTVSVPDLLHGGAELERQARAVDLRLQELRSRLGLRFPVYLLVTKVDLLAGFVEFFGDLDAAQREQPWGIVFDNDPAGGAGGLADGFAAQLAQLPARISALTPRRLQDEPLLQRRVGICHFAAQVEALIPALEGFARRAFASGALDPRQPVRGIHLSSGTQEGSPIDRVLGELARGYGIELQASPQAEQRGRAYFIAGLLQRLVIAESALAGTSLQRRRRRRWFAGAAGTAIAGALVLACAAWLYSFQGNLHYVDAVRARVDQVARQVDPAHGGDLDQLLPTYALLSQMASSGDIDADHAPWGFDFGLFQGPRLARSADQTYHRVLDRTLAPLLAQRLAQALRQESDAVGRYEALRVTLMLATPSRLQRAEVRRWAARAFGAPGAAPASQGGEAPGAGEQQEWLRHLDALLERNAVLEAVRIDDATLRAARAALAGVPLEQRVHDRLLRRAREQLERDQTLAELASPAAVLAFAPPDAPATLPAIPVAFTRRAWLELIEPAVEPTIAEVADEAVWVLADGSQAVQRLLADRTARDSLARQVGARHAKAMLAHWDRLLGALALQPPADAEALGRFGSMLAGPDSPLRQLLRRFAAEFALSAPGAAAAPAAAAYEAVVGEHFAVLRDYAQAAGPAVVDRLVAPLADAVREPAAPRAGELVRELRAESARAPAPFKETWARLADALGSLQRRAIDSQIGAGLAELAQACRRLTADRFPFAAGARRDMPIADFARLFGPRGLLDSYFRGRLASQVDTRKRPWRLLGESATPDKAQASLRSFELADDIRRLFFPPGFDLPQLRLQLTPAAMDGELLSFSADIDGQLMRYENGPRRPKPVLWPGPAATQRVLLRILPPGPAGVGAEVHEGPWALLRVLQRGGWQRGSGSAALARLEVDGRTLNLEVSADAPVPAALLGELSRFRCPEPW